MGRGGDPLGGSGGVRVAGLRPGRERPAARVPVFRLVERRGVFPLAVLSPGGRHPLRGVKHRPVSGAGMFPEDLPGAASSGTGFLLRQMAGDFEFISNCSFDGN